MGIFKNESLTPAQRERIENEGHLVFVDGEGGATALMPGSLMGIVTDPTKADGVLHLILSKVTRKKLVFVSFSKLQHGKEGERRRLTFELTKNEAL